MSSAIATTRAAPSNGQARLITARGEPMPPSASYLQAQAEAERHKRLDDAWNWYTGDVHGQIRGEPGQPDPNVVSNRAATIVDTGVDFLTGKTVRLEVLKGGTPNKDAQDCLDHCWGNDDRRMTTMSKLAQNGGIFGHIFARVVPPDEPRRPYCRVVVLDPAQLTVVTDQDDCDTVVAYMIDWQEAASPALRQLTVGKRQIITRIDPDDDADDYYGGTDPDSRWEISNWMRGPNNAWYEVGEPIAWDHPWAPVSDWQNLPLANMHWGQSDIPRNVQHLNSVLNLALSNVNVIGKHHSFPWLYASGVGLGATIEVGPGKLTQLQAPEAKLQAVEAHGDLPGLLGFAEDLRSDMDEQTRVPGVATGRFKDLPKATSGVALQMLYGPLLSKTAHKQRLYAEGFAELSLRMLSLCGFGDGTGEDGWEVKVHWPSPLPNDDASTAQLALAAEQVGMSQHFICQLLNADYDEEMEHRRNEAQDQMTAYAHGQGMPPATMMAGQGMSPAVGLPGAATTPAQASSGPAGRKGMAPAQPGQTQQNMPPVNHPAAQAARAAAKAAGAAMKGA